MDGTGASPVYEALRWFTHVGVAVVVTLTAKATRSPVDSQRFRSFPPGPTSVSR